MVIFKVLITHTCGVFPGRIILAPLPTFLSRSVHGIQSFIWTGNLKCW